MKKKCYTCQTEKETTEFNKNKCRKDGLNSICKECSRKRSRQYYKENPELHKKNVRKHNIKYRKLIYEFVNSQKKKCYNCTETDPCCLDFHHLRDKESCVSTLINSLSKKKIIREIAKCIVLCSNCHRKLHAGRFKL